jgi:hypothetical protein
MKCTKCGYVSFDYLSECKKCGINLAGIRETLGFQGAKSNVPFFLGSLLKDYVKPSAGDEKHLTEPASKPSFDFDDIDLAESFGNVEPAAKIAAERAGAPAAEPLETEDFNLLDISDEELGISTMDDENEPASAKGLRPAASVEAGFDEVSSAGAMSADTNRLIPQFDVSSLPGLATQTSMGTSCEPGLAIGKVEALPEGAIDENLIIDLSDKDLENFLSELDDPSAQENAAESPESASKPGKGE